jgi:hypothetical protein
MPAARLGDAAEGADQVDLDDALKAVSGKCLISPVALSRLAVLTALPVPAQLTRMRSWPMAARALAKAGVDLLLGGDVDLAEHAAELALGERLALLGR